VKENYETRTELTKKGVGNNNRDVVIFAFFLLLSFVFWYLNSLGKEIEAGIKYPVRFTNLPRERAVITEPDVRLNIYLKGSGTSILKLKLSGDRKPVAIDISKVSYKRVPGSKNLDYYIITSGLARSLGVQIRSGCEITSIKPDTLFFTLEKAGQKTGQASAESVGSGSRNK
jgi:hypothetical protein